MINTLKDSKGYVIKCQFNLARIILHTALVAHLNIEIWKPIAQNVLASFSK